MVEEKICFICKKPILPGQAWTYDEKGRPVHWTCKELAATETFRTEIVRSAKRAIMKEAQKVMLKEIKGGRVEYICPICGKPVYPGRQASVYVPEKGVYMHLKCYEKWLMR